MKCTAVQRKRDEREGNEYKRVAAKGGKAGQLDGAPAHTPKTSAHSAAARREKRGCKTTMVSAMV